MLCIWEYAQKRENDCIESRPFPCHTVSKYITIVAGDAGLKTHLAYTAVLWLVTVIAAGATEIRYPKVVLELFTSQGCSSCPPADKVVADLAGQTDILALSLNVDYWDRLGWIDTLARPENTKRQYGYAQSRGDRQVYTPQIVIDGDRHYVGSRRGQIEGAVSMARMGKSNIKNLDVRVRQEDGSHIFVFDVPMEGSNPNMLVKAYGYRGNVSVDIGRGENVGRRVTYHNVVHKVYDLGRCDGRPLHLELSNSEVQELSGLAVIVQPFSDTGIPGPITAASQVIF